MAKSGAAKKKSTKSPKRASGGKKKNKVAQPYIEKAIKVEDDYFEVEKVVDKRKRGKKIEYKIRWKGCTEEDDTWEPARNLCDTAYVEAMKFEKTEAEETGAKKPKKETNGKGGESKTAKEEKSETKNDSTSENVPKKEDVPKKDDVPKKEDAATAGGEEANKDQSEKEKS
mmetsp:Transcript_25033/g.36986  ORF Transcript_25033/g.36986 Transcript_25033/m.36986 type:complete len:171 (+) Transcript_25033:63-575(+)